MMMIKLLSLRKGLVPGELKINFVILEDVYAIVDNEMSVDLKRKVYLKEVNLQLYEVPIFV